VKLQHLLILVWLWLELTALGLVALASIALFNPFKGLLAVWIAFAIYIALGLLVFTAIRYRLRRSQWVASRCPTCSSLLYRSQRRPVNRILHLFVPLQRYYCVNPQCRWQGLRIKPLRKTQELPMKRLSKTR